MIRTTLQFIFGVCIAAPFAVALANAPLPHAHYLESAVYTAVEDGKISDAVSRASRPMPIVLDPATVRGQVARYVASKPKATPSCSLRRLEQGGSPSSPFVLVCG